VLLASCDAVTCANPRTTETGSVPADAVWTTPDGLGDGVVALDHDGVRIGG
jgi:hypothetical protein